MQHLLATPHLTSRPLTHLRACLCQLPAVQRRLLQGDEPLRVVLVPQRPAAYGRSIISARREFRLQQACREECTQGYPKHNWSGTAL
jgi:hypothetical protein